MSIYLSIQNFMSKFVKESTRERVFFELYRGNTDASPAQIMATINSHIQWMTTTEGEIDRDFQNEILRNMSQQLYFKGLTYNPNYKLIRWSDR